MIVGASTMKFFHQCRYSPTRARQHLWPDLLNDKLPAPLPLFPHMLHAITKVTKVAQKASRTSSAEEGSVIMPRRAPLMVLH